MIYFYILLFYFSSISLQIRYLKNNISKEFLTVFFISFSYTNIFILYENCLKNNIFIELNPLFLFFYFLVFFILLYSTIVYFLLSSIQEYRYTRQLYFIET